MDLPEALYKPCNDCPWRKNALPGWLGPYSAERWIQLAHSDEAIACHETIHEDYSWEGAFQCAGAASYRANVAKRPRDPQVAVGPRSDDVFSSPREFTDYHS